MSNRTRINDLIVSSLKQIDGRASPYDTAYNFKTDLRDNIYRGLKYLDEINDFPSIYITSGREIRKFNTNNNTEAKIESTLRCYVNSDDPVDQINNLVLDVEHILYNFKGTPDLQLFDVNILTVLTDSGLLHPYGMAEIFLSTRFEIFKS
jgi:hypothetical protein